MLQSLESLLNDADPFNELPVDMVDKIGLNMVEVPGTRSARASRRFRIRLAELVAGAVLAVTGLVLATVLGLGGSSLVPAGGNAAAAELRQLAATTGAGPVVPPPSGSVLFQTLEVSLINASKSSGAVSTSGSDEIDGAVSVWTNAVTECTGATFGNPIHTNDLAAAAWAGAGLSSSPINQQINGVCEATSPLQASNVQTNTLLSSGFAPIDVSSLPTNPAQLATELENGDIGIANLDQGIAQSGVANVGLERAALLLFAPEIGDSVTFHSELYDAMALLPGVRPMGTVTTHAGVEGAGFESGTGLSAVEVVVDPGTGELIEVSNFQYSPWIKTWMDLIVTSFDSSRTALGQEFIPPLSDELQLRASWIDMTSTPTDVSSASVPPLTGLYSSR